MGLRTLLFLFALGLVYLALRNYLGRGKTLDKQPRTPAFRKTLRCDHCGTHVPSEEAVKTASGSFCCPEHATAKESVGVDPDD
ncbi:MAG: hypothetical protein C3L25_03965 [Candidatus Sedimenticola endophacoides]|uniref:Preprotein translocase subunit YajC n=1 Tax=Candidatus Sedimenticola endophacoides TaxID=2548426 RepID=A0A6N4DZR2_9GAMM|nr:MAG: hypothetical protein C3L26_03975 [Candidatus Sedimenticola endophacoides]PUE04049.1 MAG: hypothetical protein C3L24_03820 [Candidatus Sedimenticola endophacoides]PUE04551.1 MAG: hypothetical protein C3L25_03965 [Candidatus Sedimenticola endophacoides]